ncbi:uncharacterized protein [Triticum aestivum]|uniref:uncharacterized protein n=1 Tax=Triticum aestivum TaxID=4565 RepID=UPI001D02F6E2|nr:uncharacterized protein LOC123101847 [Triticum aestivum]
MEEVVGCLVRPGDNGNLGEPPSPACMDLCPSVARVRWRSQPDRGLDDDLREEEKQIGHVLSTVRFSEIQWFAHIPYPSSFSLPHSRRVPAPSFLVSFSSRRLPSPPRLPAPLVSEAASGHQTRTIGATSRPPPHRPGGARLDAGGQHDSSLRATSRWVLPPNGKGSDGLHFPRWPAGYGTGGVKPSSSDASTLSRIELALSRCLAEGAAPTCHRIVAGPRPSAMASSQPIFSPTLEL